MIRYIEHNDIDKSKWDECIEHAFNGLIYGYSWWLDTVSSDWDALIEDDYERVFPLTFRKKYGVYYLYQPYFTQQLGVFSKKILTEEVVLEFLNKIPSKFRFAEILMNAYNQVESDRFVLQEQINHELDLINTYENIQRKYSSNMKRNIKKSAKFDLTIVKSIKPDQIVELFRNNKGREVKTLQDNDFNILKRIIYTCMYKGLADIVGVYNEMNTLIAGAVFLKAHKRSTFIFSGLSEEGREKSAMPFLIDSYIKENAGTHMILDFDGSNNEQLARFYHSFGSKRTNYFRLDINRLGRIENGLLKLMKKL